MGNCKLHEAGKKSSLVFLYAYDSELNLTSASGYTVGGDRFKEQRWNWRGWGAWFGSSLPDGQRVGGCDGAKIYKEEAQEESDCRAHCHDPGPGWPGVQGRSREGIERGDFCLGNGRSGCVSSPDEIQKEELWICSLWGAWAQPGGILT